MPTRPFLFGRQLWRETRIALFEQATDTRPEELKAQGVRPRVWFGERWITSVFDLFEENARYFPALLPICDDEDPVAVARRAASAPALAELRLHNGTVYRWNRPVYAVVDGRPHLRVENRVLPAGPTVVDMWPTRRSTTGWSAPSPSRSGRSGRRCRSARPRRTSTPAPGTASTRRLYWPGIGEVPATELVLRRLLPLAHAGLDSWGVDAGRPRPAARHHRGALHDRASTARRGRSRPSAARSRRAPTGSRLRRMLERYIPSMHSNEPVHTWER